MGTDRKAYKRVYYQKNKIKIKSLVNKRRLTKLRQIQKIKSVHGCMKCGIKDHRVLDFHHRDHTTKNFPLGWAACRSWKNIIKEIEKCDLLCRNCHAVLHFKNGKKYDYKTRSIGSKGTDSRRFGLYSRKLRIKKI